MDDDDASTDVLIARQRQYEDAAAEIGRQLRQRVGKLKKEIPKLEDQTRTETQQLARDRTVYNEKVAQVKAAQDAKLAEIEAAKEQVGTAVETIETLEEQLDEARDVLKAAESCLGKLEKQAATVDNQSEEALKQLEKKIDDSQSALTATSTVLDQTKKELQRLESKFTAAHVTNVDPSTSKSTRADPTQLQDQDRGEKGTAGEHGLFVEERAPAADTSTISKTTVVRPEIASGVSVGTIGAGRMASDLDRSAPNESGTSHNISQRSSLIIRNTPAEPLSTQAVSQTQVSSTSTSNATPARDVNGTTTASTSEQSPPRASSPVTEAQPTMGHEDMPQSSSTGDSRRRRGRRSRVTVANMTARQLELHSQLQSFYGLSEGSDRDEETSKAQGGEKTRVLGKAVGEGSETDEEEQVTIDPDDTTYGQTRHECSLSSKYPTVMYIKESDRVEGRWCELKCFVCSTNTSVERFNFFAGIRPLVMHISHSHGVYPRNEVARKCVVQEFSQDDVENLLHGRPLLKGRPIDNTWGDLARRKLRLDEMDAPSDAAPDEHVGEANGESNTDVQEHARSHGGGIPNGQQDPRPPIRKSHSVETSQRENDRNIHAASKGDQNVARSSDKLPVVSNKATLPTQRTAQPSTAIPRSAATHGVALSNTHKPINSMLQRGEAIRSSTATVPHREPQTPSKPPKPARFGGTKRTHSELTPPKPSPSTEILRSDLPGIALLDGKWRKISCRECSANADRSPYDNALNLFQGLEGLAKHVKTCHPGRVVNMDDPKSFASGESLPQDFQAKSQYLGNFRIVPHAGDKASGSVKPGAVAVKSNGYLDEEFPSTVPINGAWFWISCKTCSAHTTGRNVPIRGVRSLAHHVRNVHGKETDFDDLASWCTLTGPIAPGQINKIEKWGDGAVVPTPPEASNGNRSKDPRLGGGGAQPQRPSSIATSSSPGVQKTSPALPPNSVRLPKSSENLRPEIRVTKPIDRSTLSTNDLFFKPGPMPPPPSRVQNVPQQRSSTGSPPGKKTKTDAYEKRQ
ncbi:hypothetical protein CKM354_000634300 [Cercospora kikuchii]|uniref:Uncharacterized protein n=1 Tax=Cercospora kikuchii TaxID=84275 RepID=A0A9P3CHZ3_9PEZI|nr:uncharacterized protein CKM354_000634300 [Cercospora kikuchii]GIZ43103.1 hypothetical protein CKM354_000634300 [Cercospora kikuchii]